MSTLLIGWELGAGSGHVQRMVPLVDRFLRDGWKVVVASRDVRLAVQLLAPAATSRTGQLEIRQAPIFLHRSPQTVSASSRAEMLARIGFADVELLRPVVAAWEAILRELRPSVIISDTAPSLNIAAFGRIRVIGVGSGWAIPPESVSSALFREPPDLGEGAELAAQKVLQTVHRLIRKNIQIERFSDLLRGTENFVCTLQQLDPYRPVRTEPLYWPLEVAAPSDHLNGDPREGGGFIYLPKKHPALPAVVAAVARGSTPFRAYFGGQPQSGRNLRTSIKPLDLAKDLQNCVVAIHHGGLGTATWCLTRRVPQMICCLDYEKLLIARGVGEAGGGVAFAPNIDVGTLAQTVDRLSRLRPRWPDYRHLVTLSPEATIDAIVHAAAS